MSKLLTIVLVLLAVLLSAFLFVELLKYGVYFHFVDSFARKSGLNVYLVYALAAALLAPFVIGVRYCLSFFRAGRQRLGAAILLGMASLYNLGLFSLTRGTFFDRITGEPTQYCAITPDDVKCYDRPGVDPLWGIRLEAATPEKVRIWTEVAKRPFHKLDPATAVWFDQTTGIALLWYVRSAEGGLEFYSRPGFHPGTRERLEPVTEQLRKEWYAQEKARAAVTMPAPGQEPAQNAPGAAPTTTAPAETTPSTTMGETQRTLAETVSAIPPTVAPTVMDKPLPPSVPKTVTLTPDMSITVRLAESLSSEKHQPGDAFVAILDRPLVVEGLVVAERGNRVEGRIIGSEKAGRAKGVSHLVIELVRLDTSDGQRVAIRTDTFERKGATSKGRDAAKVGIGAGLGAAIGVIAGGGRGAAIGAAAGGTAGTGAVLATRGEPAVLPVETRIAFRLKEPVTIVEKRR